MTQPKIVSFVLSGGVGSRLWPLSREDNPKQFHDVSGQGSMLSRTLRRMAARTGGETPLHVIAAERHASRILDDLAGVDIAGGRAIFEPVGRNTAAAVAVAVVQTLERFGDELVLIVPSDHQISTDAQFWACI
ncbi:mannose-1-phosphate guanylyltransferase, partial [Salmonella enterica subsp. enterica serovar Kottbus]|nr:mannose-1-phosphate guanylyltransferase [Salmonella enterica subsp. enterica serovar Kottbus]